MNVYKYGIAMEQRFKNHAFQWRIAILDGPVSGHGFVDVPEDLFNFRPEPGSSVKAKFKDELSDHPLFVSKCETHEWIRDVEVIDQKVVIFAIINLTDDCLSKKFQGETTSYYIVQNEDTDFRRVAIPSAVLETAMRSRSSLQKQNEPLVYRVGVVWDPLPLDGITANWRCYNDFPLVPIFELYFRETTLPYISDSMVYGVLEGIVIARNECGLLFWTRGMGCAILSSVTRDTNLPPLGSVSYMLIRRCLPENSFGFSCSYELLPETIDKKWEGVRVVTDELNQCVYIQANCECVLMKETGAIAMMMPHIGKVHRGLQPYRNRLTIGMKYNIRAEFRIERNTFVPVIVDVLLADDEFVQCRVVHVSREAKKYIAVLEPGNEVFDRCKHLIDYIKIPFRVMFCSQGVCVDEEELLAQCFFVRIRRPRKIHDTVSALHVENVTTSFKDSAFAVFNKTVLIRTMVKKVDDSSSGAIVLVCPRLEQKILDLHRLSAEMPKSSMFAVYAQFVLTSDKIPMFLVRNVAPTTHQLPRLNAQIVASLPPVDLNSAPVQTQNVEEQLEKLSVKTLEPVVEAPVVLANKPPAPEIPSKQEDRTDCSVISSNYDVIITESFLAASSSASTASTLRSRANSEFSFDSRRSQFSDSISNASSTYGTSRKAVSGTGFSRYNTQNRTTGFGPSSYNQSAHRIRRDAPRRRPPLKYGMRQLTVVKNHVNVLEDVVYRHMNNRKMFIDNERDSIESWFHPPKGKVTSAKKSIVFVIPIEVISYAPEVNKKNPRFTELIRFVCQDKIMDVFNVSVVVPSGGQFPKMPKSFQLGERYKVEHFSFIADRMCRFNGFATGLKTRTFYLEQPSDHITKKEIMTNKMTNEYLRFRTKVLRPYEIELESDTFELWTCQHLPGFVIVEKRQDLMDILEPMDNKEDEDSHTYSATIEPVAGGPMEISILKDFGDDDRVEMFVFWRLVMEFSTDSPVPQLIQRNEKGKRIEPTNRVYYGSHTINDYGMWKTLEINSRLAQKRLDMFRAMNDPRVKMIDGPDLKPEIEVRKVDVDSRRKNMFNALSVFKKYLPMLKEESLFNYIFEEDYDKLVKRWLDFNDNFHAHQCKQRNFSLEEGLNYITELLLLRNNYLTLYSQVQFVPLLEVLADCIGLNSTYVKKTDEVKKMIYFFRQRKLIKYL